MDRRLVVGVAVFRLGCLRIGPTGTGVRSVRTTRLARTDWHADLEGAPPLEYLNLPASISCVPVPVSKPLRDSSTAFAL